MYTFHYQLTEEDYVEYNLYHNYSIPAYRSRLMAQRFVIPWLFMTIIFCIGTAYNYPIIIYVIFAAFPVGWILFYRKLVIRNVRKNIETVKASGNYHLTKKPR